MTTAPDDRYFDPTTPLGVTRRYSTARGKRASLCVTRTATGWSWYDHRTGTGGYRGLKGLDQADTLRLLTSRKKHTRPWEQQDTLVLPPDTAHVLPPYALVWLYQAGLTDAMIVDLDIGWSETEGRVVIPVYDRDGRLVFWQGRYLGPKDPKIPKYINLRVKKKHVYFHRQGATPLVIVEDVLSAVRVNAATGSQTLALLGAFVPDDLIIYSATAHSQIVLWLDFDKRLKVFNWVRRFRGFGFNIRSIITRRDPKLLSDDEIRDRVGAL